MLHSPPTQPLRLAVFHQPPPAEPLLRDWLQPSRNALFRWTMAMARSDEARRLVAEAAVAIQRQGGVGDFQTWLYATALQAAAQQGDTLPEASLAGLPPEVRALLRLVAHRGLQRADAEALLVQRMDVVRQRLVQARLSAKVSEHQ